MSAKVQVGKYFAALERLKARGDPISNDAVSREAGSGPGSIKKSRLAYTDLIAAIDAAALEQAEARLASDPVPALKRDIDELKRRLDKSLEREIALLNELYDLRAMNKQLKEDNNRLRAGRLVPVQ